jgi:hypothetical protein
MIVKRVKTLQVAYYREELKAKGCNPDIRCSIKDDYTKEIHIRLHMMKVRVMKALGFKVIILVIMMISAMATPYSKCDHDFQLDGLLEHLIVRSRAI